MLISIYSLYIWIVAIFTGGTVIAIYLGSDEASSKSFSFSVSLVTLWIIIVGFLLSTKNYSNAVILTRLPFLLSSLIAISFTHFFYTFPENVYPPKRVTLFLISLSVVFIYLFMFTGEVIDKPFMLEHAPGFGWHFGGMSYLFELSFFGFFAFGIRRAYLKYKAATDLAVKRHIKYIVSVVVVGSIPPSLLSIILPRFGYFDLNWLGPITELFWIPIIAYSIVRHRLFSVKVIAIELVTFSLWTIILIRTFLATDIHEILVEGGTLILTVIFGVLLIRSVLQEMRQRIKLEELSADLEKANEVIDNLKRGVVVAVK